MSEASMILKKRVKKVSFSLRKKLIFSMVLVLFILTSVFTIFHIYEQKRSSESRLLGKARGMVSILKTSSIEPLSDFNVGILRKFLSNALDQPEVLYAYIFDVDGRILTDGTEYNPYRDEILSDPISQKAILAEEDLIQNTDDILDFTAPVYSGETRLGGVRIGLSLKGLNRELRDVQNKNISLGLLVILVAVMYALFFSKKINQPIVDLLKGVDAINQGDFDVKVNVKSNDEVEVLADAFNHMVVNLKETIISKEKAEELKNVAEKAVQAKSYFLANMSHEIRTPMNAILGFSDLLERTRLNEKQKNYIQSIKVSGQLLVGIIDDILDVSKLEAGKIRLEVVDFNIEDIIYDVFQMVISRIRERPFDTYVDIASDVPLILKGDPTRLKQVFVNLLGNAIKFTTHGDIGVIVKKSFEQPSGDQIRLEFTVKDTGIGIPDDKKEKIFQSFSQADESTTRQFGGTGLGLTITKALVEVMGGDIWVESEVGKGSEFFFTIVLEMSERKAKDVDSFNSINDKTVFIVDDNMTSLKVIEKCCDALNLKVIGLSLSPQEALHKLDKLLHTKNMVPDIILSDIMMAGMTGFEMVEKIQKVEAFKNTAFIAVTADIEAEVANNPQHHNFNAYVTKPISKQALLNAFNSIITATQLEEKFAATNDEHHGSCANIKLLVVEDVIANQLLLNEYFSQLGCEATFANNGQEAIDILKDGANFDLCLMDLQMPIMGGVEATVQIRKHISKNLPIIALSAAILNDDKQQAEAAGMNDFLAKPVNLITLKAAILKYARSKKSA